MLCGISIIVIKHAGSMNYLSDGESGQKNYKQAKRQRRGESSVKKTQAEGKRGGGGGGIMRPMLWAREEDPFPRFDYAAAAAATTTLLREKHLHTLRARQAISLLPTLPAVHCINFRSCATRGVTLNLLLPSSRRP